MSRFVLQPARLLQNCLVPDRTVEPLELGFKELCAYLGRNAESKELLKLATLRRNMYIGRSKHRKDPRLEHIFFMIPPSQVGDLSETLKRDPSFEERMIEAFWIEEAQYDKTIVEESTKGSPDYPNP